MKQKSKQQIIPAAQTGRLISALLRFVLLALFSSVVSAAPASVGFWYTGHPPVSELSQYDWVVLEPGHVQKKDIAFIKSQKSIPFAYLSVGEFAGTPAEMDSLGIAEQHRQVRNTAWSSQVMHPSDTVWQNFLLRRAGELAEQGYEGLFLDTLDSFNLLPESQRESERKALVALIRRLHTSYPDLKLFFNRGFEIIPELKGIPAAVAVESIYAGWDASSEEYRSVSQQDRDWLRTQLTPLQQQGIPVIAIEYLPYHKQALIRDLVKTLSSEGFIPFISSPGLDRIGNGPVNLIPRRIAVVYDPRDSDITLNSAHIHLGGLLEYLGYRVDYISTDKPLSGYFDSGLYAGIVCWMNSGPPPDGQSFDNWVAARIRDGIPVAFLGGLPFQSATLAKSMGLFKSNLEVTGSVRIVQQDNSLIGHFEAPARPRRHDLTQTRIKSDSLTPLLTLEDSKGQKFNPAALAPWGGYVQNPYVLEETPDNLRWIADPFSFLKQALKLRPMPHPDATTENGRRIVTVHIDGDGFPSRAEVPGTPYSGIQVLDDFIQPYPFLTTASVIEGEIGPKGMYPHLSKELEPIARKVFADPKVEVATHTYSHPFFWQPELASKREGFHADYGISMKIPGYDFVDYTREIVGSAHYINSRLTTPEKPVKMVLWSGDALPSGDQVKLAYDSGLENLNGGVTAPTNANPSMTNVYPLIRPTTGGLQFYAPVINENVYTNEWHGPYYGYRDVIETFKLTDTPRRLRGIHIYYHFYSGTKQAAIKAMKEIYRYALTQNPISLWLSDYVQRAKGLYYTSLSVTPEGDWVVHGLKGLRTLRLDKELGWPDLGKSEGVAGVTDLPQGRYVTLSANTARLSLRKTRDPRPALEQANIPLTRWQYTSSRTIEADFSGEFPLDISVRSESRCVIRFRDHTYTGEAENDHLWHFQIPYKQVENAQVICQ